MAICPHPKKATSDFPGETEATFLIPYKALPVLGKPSGLAGGNPPFLDLPTLHAEVLSIVEDQIRLGLAFAKTEVGVIMF